MIGRIHNVKESKGGTSLVTAVGPGATVLVVDSVELFEDVGFVNFGVETSPYSVLNRTLNTITIDVPVYGNWYVDEGVFPVPKRVHRYVDVVDADGSFVQALVPNVLRDKVPLGTRNFGQGELAQVERIGFGWQLVDLPGLETVIDFSSVPLIGKNSAGGLVRLDEDGQRGFDPAGEVTLDISGDGNEQGISSLYVGDVFSPSVPNRISQDVNYFVDPDTGDDDNNGRSTGAAFRTLQHALDQLPNFFDDANVVITVVSGSQLNEDIKVSGFFGSGSLTITGEDRTATTVNGTLSVDGCSMNIVITSFLVFDTGNGPSANSGTVEVNTSRHVLIDDIKVDTDDEKEFSFHAKGGSVVKVSNSDMHGGTGHAMGVAEQSTLYSLDNKGGAAGDSIQNQSSLLFVDGTRPQGSVDDINHGQSYGVVGSTEAAGTGATGITKKTAYFPALTTATWRPKGWVGIDDHIRQGHASDGGNYKGLWFYDHAAIASRLSGKTINTIYMKVARRNSGGTSSAQTIKVGRHNHADSIIGGAEPTLAGGTDVGGLKWGRSRWARLPDSFAEAIRDGTAKGVGVYFEDPRTMLDRYAIISGLSERGDSGKLRITYH